MFGRRLRLERLEDRLSLSVQSWNMAADFSADFAGGLPQHNPNGVWAYLGTDGTVGSLVKTNGANPSTFGVGAGWAESDGVPSYARGGSFGFPAASLTGHGPNRIVWTAPATADLGGVNLSGFFTQAPFEPARQMQMRIYKNDFFTPLLTVDANFNPQSTVVPLPEKRIAIRPGDTLTIVIDGAGPMGNGVSTFTASNVIITEFQLEGDYNFDAVVNTADYVVWRKNVDASGTPGEVPGDGTSSGNLAGVPDGVVDTWDYQFWKANFGKLLDPGGMPLVYHPAAIIVQPSGVTLPDGSSLDTAGSQTHGLQEAFNLSAQQGWDVFVMPGTYSLNAHVDIEELQLRTFRFEDVTLNFDSIVTDFGIRFDSTMLTNLYWNGGAINAPQATHGLLYQPRTPHPLDGVKFGTIGVVDSTFHFNVDITAATHKVTMNSLQATINDITFYFKNVARNQINYVGGGFASYNVFEAARTDDPIPFDLFSTAGRVTVVPPASDITAGLPGVIYLPDGSRLSVAGTQTFGLQEAFNYAAANNLDVLVFGRGVRNVAPFTNLGLYNLNAPLVVSDLVNRQYRIYGVTFNYGVGGNTLQIADVVDSTFELTGQVVATQATNGILVRPDGLGVQNSSIRVQATVGGTGTADTLVRIDPTVASVQNNLLYFHEVNTGANGIKLMSPSSTTVFTNNLVRTLHTHAISNVGVQVADGAANSQQLHHNTLEVRTNTDRVPGYAALQIWADFNTIDIFALNTGLTFGARLESSSNDNVLYVGQLQAATPLVNVGTNNQVLPHPASGASFDDAGSITGAGAFVGGNELDAQVKTERPLGVAQTASSDTFRRALLALQRAATTEDGRSARPPSVDVALEQWDQHHEQRNGLTTDDNLVADWAWLSDLTSTI
jgi:hypothetical protein